MWNKHVDKILTEFDMHRLSADFCVYAMHDGEKRVFLGLFVDDMFIIGAIMKCMDLSLSMHFMMAQMMNMSSTNSPRSTRFSPSCMA